MLTWHYITRKAFDDAAEGTKTADKLYFISDTHEIYKGTQLFNESVTLVTEFPASGAAGRLYVDSTTLEGKIWNGTAWTPVIQPVQSTLSATDTAKPVSGKAVAGYVAAELAKVTGSKTLVAGVAYTQATNALTVTMADKSTTSVPLTGTAVDLTYDSKTGELKVKNASGTALGTGVKLDLERFVKEATYDKENKKIILSFNDESTPLEIEVGDLVDTYTAKSSTTVSLTVTGNEFTAEAIVSADEGNMLKKTANGLFVAATDVSGKIDKVADATANAVATLTADGQVADSKVKIGGAALAETTNASTLATEAAVAAVRTALQTAINGKMAKVAASKTDEVLIATADGNAAVSGVKIGGEAMKATKDASTLATEKAVETYVTGYAVAKTAIVANGKVAATVAAASDAKVASEKAFVDAMTWKTTA